MGSNLLPRFKFSEIEFTENPVAVREGLKSESIGCIQIAIKKKASGASNAGHSVRKSK